MYLFLFYEVEQTNKKSSFHWRSNRQAQVIATYNYYWLIHVSQLWEKLNFNIILNKKYIKKTGTLLAKRHRRQKIDFLNKKNNNKKKQGNKISHSLCVVELIIKYNHSLYNLVEDPSTPQPNACYIKKILRSPLLRKYLSATLNLSLKNSLWMRF